MEGDEDHAPVHCAADPGLDLDLAPAGADLEPRPTFSTEEPRVRPSVKEINESTEHKSWRPRRRRKGPDAGVRVAGSTKSAKGDA